MIFFRILFSVLISMAVLSQGQTAFAALKCESVYASQAQIFALQQGIQRDKNLWNRFLWRSYLRKWNPEKNYTPASFEQAIASSYLVLHQLKLRQGLISEQTFGGNREEIIRWTEKTLMKEGLKGYLEKSYSTGVTPAWPRRIYQKVESILSKKAFRVLWHLVMWTLPNKIDKEVPPALLAKVIVDGLDPHFPELERAYGLQRQNKIESYRHLQTIVKYFSLTFTAMMSFHNMENYIEKQQAQAKQELVTQVEQVDKGLDEIERMLDIGEFD